MVTEQLHERYLLTRIGGHRVAIDAARVQEIVPLGVVTRIPGAAAIVSGVMNVRGVLVIVVNGGAVLALERFEPSVVVLLRTAERTVGIAVNEVMDFMLDADGTVELRARLPGLASRFVKGVGQYDGDPFVVLDIETLLQPILRG